MPRTRDCKWDGFSAGLRPRGGFFPHWKLTYLYLSDVDLDLEITCPIRVEPAEVIQYEWELSCEHNEKIEADSEVHKNGKGTVEIGRAISAYRKSHEWDMRKLERKFKEEDIVVDVQIPEILFKSGTVTKERAVGTGLLKHPGRYWVKIKLTNSAGKVVCNSTCIQFTVIDADNLTISLIQIGWTVLAGFIGSGIGALITLAAKGVI